MLTIKNLSFGYFETNLVLNNISFFVPQGKTMAIVGASGCGKSTLLRLISDILPNTKNFYLNGEISINGYNTNEYRKQNKLSFMFQEPTLLPHLNVLENIAFPLTVKEEEFDSEIFNLAKAVGLQSFQTYMPKSLSGGMKTRVALARSFATKPKLLLLDEPFSALDIAWKSDLYIELEKLKEQTNCTAVIVTHDVQEALLLADSIIVLNSNGTIEFSKEIISEMNITQRISNISKFMESVYQSYMLPIQDAIIHGKNIHHEA